MPEHTLLKALVNSIEDIVFTLDTEQKHTSIYGKWLERSGFEASFFIGKTAEQLFGEAGAIHREANEKAIRGETVKYEWQTIWANDGSVLYIETTLSPIYDEQNKNIIGIVGIGRNITEQKLAEKALIESETRYKHLLDTIAEGVIEYNHVGTIVSCNLSASHILGLSVEEMINKNYQDAAWYIVDEMGNPFPQEKIPLLVALQTGKPVQNIIIGLHKPNKTLIWIRINATPLFCSSESTKPSGVVVSFSDITSIKQSEIEIRELSKTLSDFMLAINSASIISMSDLKGTILYANDNLIQISGYTDNELLYQNHNILNSGYHEKTFWRNFWETITSGKIWRGEIKNKTKYNTYYWVDTFVIPFFDENEKLAYYLSIRNDITERKEVEEKLRENERHFREILENLSMMAVILDKEGRVMFCNDFLLQKTAWKKHEIMHQNWFDLMLPIHIREDVKKVFYEELMGKQNIIEHFQNSILTKNNKLRYVNWCNSFLRNTKGEVIGTVSIGEDITHQIKTQQALQKSERRFRSYIKDAPYAIFVANARGKYIRVNEEAEKLTGYSAQELTRMTFVDILAIEEVARIREEFVNVLAGKSYSDSFKLKRKDDSIICVSIDSIKVSENEIIGFCKDITRQKQAEAEILRQNEILKEIAWIQSHEVRRPVANILGLIALFNHKNLDDPFNKDILQMLESSTHELDGIIRKIVNKTYESHIFSTLLNKSKHK